MQIAIPETNKKAGISYAVTEDGIELPVIDVTHPAFAIDISESEIDRLLQEHLRSMRRQNWLSTFAQRIFMKMVVNRSRILKGLMDSQGGFLSGMNTYLLKLGPDNLGMTMQATLIAGFPARCRVCLSGCACRMLPVCLRMA